MVRITFPENCFPIEAMNSKKVTCCTIFYVIPSVHNSLFFSNPEVGFRFGGPKEYRITSKIIIYLFIKVDYYCVGLTTDRIPYISLKYPPKNYLLLQTPSSLNLVDLDWYSLPGINLKPKRYST
jgi:hypothetical protein